ncbi:MAG TPA: hypothetical protein VF723_13990 [Pyrinomonadaceae bacterium]|jgi:hypothetical protein
MSPASKRIGSLASLLATTIVIALALNATVKPAALAQTGSGDKKAGDPLYSEYKGVRIGMTAAEARKKLGKPTSTADDQDFYEVSETESAQVYYDKERKVFAVAVSYLGEKSAAPAPKLVLGEEVQAKADGSIYKLIRYQGAGFWVSYYRTAGTDPLVTVTMQKLQ